MVTRSRHFKSTRVTVIACALGLLTAIYLYAFEYKNTFFAAAGQVNSPDTSAFLAFLSAILIGGSVAIVIWFLFKPKEA